MATDATAHLLLAPLAEPQQCLVDLVGDVFLKEGAWPVFDYVEGKLDEERVGDAYEIMLALQAPHRCSRCRRGRE